MPPVIAIFGPTAVGKTAVAVAVARALRERGEDPVAIGVDALQVYDGIPLLTAQPSAEERAELEHRLVGFVPLTEPWSVAQHTELAHQEIDAALAAGRVPIVVGGTGLYLRSALTELSLAPPPGQGVREQLLARAQTPEALEALHAELETLDPVSAALIDPTDRTRVVRAHELLAAGGSFATSSSKGQLWTEETRVPTVLTGLTMERAALRKRAGERMRAMIDAGVNFVDHEDSPARQTPGDVDAAPRWREDHRRDRQVTGRGRYRDRRALVRRRRPVASGGDGRAPH